MAAMNEPEILFERICPSCGTRSAPNVMRCACGALLMGVDLTRVAPPLTGVSGEALEDADKEAPPTARPTRTCPHADCGQPNPPDTERCVYCDRPMTAPEPGDQSEDDAPLSLIQLPTALAERYRILRNLSSRGAEAELLLVQPLAGGPERVAKIYRNGILPDAEIQARVRRIDPQSCVQVIESGVASGHAFEVMEYCAFGSLRELMRSAPLEQAQLLAVIREMAQALAAAHAVGIIHRDLKPENVLIRTREPLDLVLTDFGIASVLEATQCFTGMARTLLYAAPESLSGVIDTKADYWALGMLLLEAATGEHPFSGLSDAVILHHLSTRSIDVAVVEDPALLRLLRGLLTRAPQNRWGAAELARWLTGDTTLNVVAEQDETNPVQAYRIGKDVCQTPAQLAVALARNWPSGIRDLDNGLLQAWFREELKDQNAVRLLIEVKHERRLPPDLQLLRLILHLAPGIPPVWRGEALGLSSVLRLAARALKGEEEANRQLLDIYESRVLEEYAKAGNPELAELARRWHGGCDQFAARWNARTTWLQSHAKALGWQERPAFEELMFGRIDPWQPSLTRVLPRMLALLYDRNWEARQRSYLEQEVTRLCATSPWLTEIGAPGKLEPIELLVVEALLPDARKAALHAQEIERRRQEEDENTLRELGDRVATNLGQLRAWVDTRFFSEPVGERLNTDLAEFQEILEQVRRRGSSDPRWEALRKRLARIEPLAKRLQQELDRILERNARSGGWLSREVAIFISLATLFLFPVLGVRLLIAVCLLVMLAVGMLIARPLLAMRRLHKLLNQI